MNKLLEKSTILNDIQNLRKHLELSQEEVAFILGVTITTISRWSTNKTTEPDTIHQNRIDALKNLLQEAQEVIRPDAISWWFKTPNAVLNDLRPLDLLRSPSGFKKVKEVLFAMRWGLPT